MEQAVSRRKKLVPTYSGGARGEGRGGRDGTFTGAAIKMGNGINVSISN